jgi:hypothetical protein
MMEEWNDTIEGQRFYLETMIRQQNWLVVESHPDSAALVAKRRAKLSELKAKFGVTDEQAFLAEQARSRGEVA